MSNIQSMFQTIKEEAIRFDSYDDLDAIGEAIGEAKYVLLGEASHGTSEFYTVRAELSKKLMKEKGFSFIAVEGDWPSCFSVNRYVKGYDKKSARDALKDFNRWPTWMWANEEVLSFIQWIKDYNQTSGKNVGFYGIDVYSLWESMEEAVRLLETKGAKEAEAARKAFSCFEPHNGRAEKGSWEDLMHQTGEFNKILFFSERNRKIFNDPIGHRAIGVVYHPEYEHLGNYVPSIMSERYDGFIHIEQTTALKPIAAGEVTVD
ncbi:erythromycin esterase-like protein [Bacillus fengqiuensis]|nr:erythromycin esterase-like protein [Bacillus fengqiuensis]